jgi:hypothetical protein
VSVADGERRKEDMSGVHYPMDAHHSLEGDGVQYRTKSKRSQERRKRWAMPGREVCQMHGGRTLMGLAPPRRKTDRYSRSLPTRLAAEYERAAHDPEPLTLRHALAIVDVRINDLLGRVEVGGAGRLWRHARAAWQTMKRVQAEGRPLLQTRAARELDGLLEQAVGDDAAWHEIIQLIEQRRKLVEAETKRLVAMQQMMTTEEAMLWLGAVVAILKRHIADRETLQQISLDLSALVSHRSGTGEERR